MMLTNRSTFLHVPKTGGTWARTMIQDLIVDDYGHEVRPELLTDSHRYMFIRNPWAWYVSTYNYIASGSAESQASRMYNPLLKYFDKMPTFDEFIKAMSDPPDKLKTTAYNYVKLGTMIRKLRDPIVLPTVFGPTYKVYGDPELVKRWTTVDESFYTMTMRWYLQFATRVGKFESLKDDFLEMLHESDELTPEILARVLDSAPINKSIQVDYQSYYTPELRDIVANSCSELINKYEYEF